MNLRDTNIRSFYLLIVVLLLLCVSTFYTIYFHVQDHNSLQDLDKKHEKSFQELKAQLQEQLKSLQAEGRDSQQQLGRRLMDKINKVSNLSLQKFTEDIQELERKVQTDMEALKDSTLAISENFPKLREQLGALDHKQQLESAIRVARQEVVSKIDHLKAQLERTISIPDDNTGADAGLKKIVQYVVDARKEQDRLFADMFSSAASQSPAQSMSSYTLPVSSSTLVSLYLEEKNAKDPNLEFGSQMDEEVAIYQRFFSQREKPGVFIEFGARDGVRHSTSFFYARNLGWKGILLDPDLLQNKELLNNRPDSICINGAVCDHGTQTDFTMMVWSGWSGLRQDMHSERKSSWVVGEIPINCYGLDELLDEAGVAHVNFMVVDTEGSELSALKTFPWERVQVDLVTVETLKMRPDDEEGEQNRKNIIDFMQSIEYRKVADFFVSDDTTNFWFQPSKPKAEPSQLFDAARFEVARRKYAQGFMGMKDYAKYEKIRDETVQMILGASAPSPSPSPVLSPLGIPLEEVPEEIKQEIEANSTPVVDHYKPKS
eukprot:CAMPEP_0177660820 /NCGR_PEP_ID=MMETSP0447-20121125/18281_1 /TAXON_ID=0 /ORGANISM="Stygamoeba regulata, Strain BSH-02190019" /LENGTH=544 /DNA_ID=CAMNT_0019165985 /DNA_START=96 /DNA_END=1731 /DNA_ORIENTATION=+